MRKPIELKAYWQPAGYIDQPKSKDILDEVEMEKAKQLNMEMSRHKNHTFVCRRGET
jgi:hypothetical protein